VEAETWIGSFVRPTGYLEVVHREPWATVARVPVAGGQVWLKQCAAEQAFEPRLSAELAERHPALPARVVGFDEERRWLLLADAGVQVGVDACPAEAWAELLPGYAQLQRGEEAHADRHVRHGVPDVRPPALPHRFASLSARPQPLPRHEAAALAAVTGKVATLCDELEKAGVVSTVQHDDLHGNNVFRDRGRYRLLDWGDASIAHPFFSFTVVRWFLEERQGLPPDDPWFDRLRDAYLEPWGGRAGVGDAFALAQRLGPAAQAVQWERQRLALPTAERAAFDRRFGAVVRRALAALA
jgi:hypothetical protein